MERHVGLPEHYSIVAVGIEGFSRADRSGDAASGDGLACLVELRGAEVPLARRRPCVGSFTDGWRADHWDQPTP